MSMTEVIEKISSRDFSQMMNPPVPHNGQAYIAYDKNNIPFVACPHCGKKQFPIGKETVIRNMTWKCKASDCKKDMIINVR